MHTPPSFRSNAFSPSYYIVRPSPLPSLLVLLILYLIIPPLAFFVTSSSSSSSSSSGDFAKMSRLSAIMLQESLGSETEVTTILGLLTHPMDGVDARRSARITLKERLGLRGWGCCGAPSWGLRPTPISVRDDEDPLPPPPPPPQQEEPHHAPPDGVSSDPGCHYDATPIPASPGGMNLAAALAAERQFREGSNNASTSEGTPLRVSLMRLLEETEEGEGGRGVESDTMCCVCMGRKKGAAFIPCGHTFCRVCCREVWLNRGCCPLCNRSILEILDIF